MKKPILVVLLVLLNSGILIAQNTCSLSLTKARVLFEDGHLYDVEDMISGCLEKGFTREERIQAYHLLTLTNLYLDRHQEAENSYLKLLVLDPEFDVEENNDYVEIVYLDQKFKTTPIFTITGRAGININAPYIINDYDINESDPESYVNRTGYWIGSGVDLNINSNVKLGVELLYRRTLFEYNSRRFNSEELNVLQIQNWLSLPVSLKFVKQFGDYYPYVYGGFMVNYLLASRGEFVFSSNQSLTDGEQLGRTTENPNVNLRPLRNEWPNSLFGGIGIKKKIGYNFIFMELRYVGGLRNIVDVDQRFPLQNGYLYDFEALYQFTYLDDDIRLNAYSVSIGFEKPLYKPRKVTKAKGFFKRIFK